MLTWVFAAQLAVASQTMQASVIGVTRDGASGEPLPGAVVSLADLRRSTVSDASGAYTFAAVPPGPQHVTVRRLGYTPRTLHALVPRQGTLELDIALRAAPLRLGEIEVRPPVAVRGVDGDQDASYPDRALSGAAMRNHPLLAEPDALLALGGGEIAVRPEGPSGMHVRGGSADQTAYLLDGIPVFSPYHAAGTFSAWNPDAIERLRLESAAPSPGLPDVLAGVVLAATRSPSSELRASGGISTTGLRLTADGPLYGDAGFLVSARSSFPGVYDPEDEPSYVEGPAGDLLVKIELPALGGRAQALAFTSNNALTTAANRDSASIPGGPRNVFGWGSRSFGVEWVRDSSPTTLRVRTWSAGGSADVWWRSLDHGELRLTAAREEVGATAAIERTTAAGATLLGARITSSRTRYAVAAESPDNNSAPTTLRADTPVWSVFAEHHRELGDAFTARTGLAATYAAGGAHLSPRVEVQWSASPLLTVTASADRSLQFSQSLRNPESVVGIVFPVDLHLGASAEGIPVARANRIVLAAELRPRAGIHAGVQGYLREISGVALVAPYTGEPFAIAEPQLGRSTANGVAVDFGASGARYGLVASYGWQRVRLRGSEGSFIPEHGAQHAIEAGAVVFPTPTLSARIGFTGIAGRRGTSVIGGLEWESCTMLDWGCEFAGSPQTGGALGGTELPAYLRLDVGVRKHWHVKVGRRDATLALFGTVSNVLSRRNILTYAIDPVTGESTGIGMRPLAPLVVGADWQF